MKMDVCCFRYKYMVLYINSKSINNFVEWYLSKAIGYYQLFTDFYKLFLNYLWNYNTLLTLVGELKVKEKNIKTNAQNLNYNKVQLQSDNKVKVCEQNNQISHKYSSVQSTSKNWIFQTHMQGCRRENFTINIQLHLNDMNAEFISEWEWERERNPAGDQVQCKGVMIRQWPVSLSLAYHCCDVATLTAFTSSR